MSSDASADGRGCSRRRNRKTYNHFVVVTMYNLDISLTVNSGLVTICERDAASTNVCIDAIANDVRYLQDEMLDEFCMSP